MGTNLCDVIKLRKSIYTACLKRVIDFCCALVAMVVLSPVMLITALLVRIRLGSPVLFKQDRPGKNEKTFQLYKFRSMTDETDSEGNLLPDDVRLTGFGKKLRSTSLDELPELINILKGDMSVVGPRPLLMNYLPYYTEHEHHRHDIRPGLTGLAQINGRNAIAWEDKFEYDLEYIRKCSFALDVKIIFKTIGRVFHGSGVQVGSEITAGRFDDHRRQQLEQKQL